MTKLNIKASQFSAGLITFEVKNVLSSLKVVLSILTFIFVALGILSIFQPLLVPLLWIFCAMIIVIVIVIIIYYGYFAVKEPDRLQDEKHVQKMEQIKHDFESKDDAILVNNNSDILQTNNNKNE